MGWLQLRGLRGLHTPSGSALLLLLSEWSVLSVVLSLVLSEVLSVVLSGGPPTPVSPPGAVAQRRRGRGGILCTFGVTPSLSPTLTLCTIQGAGTTLGWSIGQCAWMAVAIAGGCSIFTIAVIMPFLRKRLHLYLDE